MDLAFLVSRPDKPSTKFRVQSYLSLLSGAGVKARVFPVSGKTVNRWRFFYSLHRYDLVIIQKKLFTPWELKYIRHRSRKLVYDFDDAVMFKKGENMDPANPLRRKRFERTVRLCDWVIAGNAYLQEVAETFSHSVSVLPTPVDTVTYLPREKGNKSEKIIIGWLGTKSTVHYLEPLVPVFVELRSKFPHVDMKIVSDSFQGMESLRGIQKVWKEAEEVQDLQSFDIGIMPLPDDPWTRGKCGFKLLQYQAVGLPTVCSAVGVNREIVAEGINGYFANTPQEWLDRLSALISSRELRIKLGKAGRESVVKEYSLEALWPQFLTTVKRALNQKRV
jgi:glycosyltransferase involved in cell wall biosynthesis